MGTSDRITPEILSPNHQNVMSPNENNRQHSIISNGKQYLTPAKGISGLTPKNKQSEYGGVLSPTSNFPYVEWLNSNNKDNFTTLH